MSIPTVVKRIVKAYQSGPSTSQWDQFLDHPAPELADLQTAFSALRQDRPAPAEHALIERIEQRRRELGDSTDVITYCDYGAGSPNEPRTEQQLRDGVANRRRVADLVAAGVPREWGMVLFRLIRQFSPTRLIELGSALGISAAYQAAALKLDHQGRLFTLEGCPQMASHARRTLDRLRTNRATVVEGRFQDRLPGVLRTLGRVDFAFIDGHHDEQATLDYYDQIAPCLTQRSIVVFDDCNWSHGMQRAWKQIRQRPGISCTICLGKFGCCLCNDPAFDGPRHFDLEYPQA